MNTPPPVPQAALEFAGSSPLPTLLWIIGVVSIALGLLSAVTNVASIPQAIRWYEYTTPYAASEDLQGPSYAAARHGGIRPYELAGRAAPSSYESSQTSSTDLLDAPFREASANGEAAFDQGAAEAVFVLTLVEALAGLWLALLGARMLWGDARRARRGHFAWAAVALIVNWLTAYMLIWVADSMPSRLQLLQVGQLTTFRQFLLACACGGAIVGSIYPVALFFLLRTKPVRAYISGSSQRLKMATTITDAT